MPKHVKLICKGRRLTNLCRETEEELGLKLGIESFEHHALSARAHDDWPDLQDRFGVQETASSRHHLQRSLLRLHSARQLHAHAPRRPG